MSAGQHRKIATTPAPPTNADTLRRYNDYITSEIDRCHGEIRTLEADRKKMNALLATHTTSGSGPAPATTGATTEGPRTITGTAPSTPTRKRKRMPAAQRRAIGATQRRLAAERKAAAAKPMVKHAGA